MRKPLRTSHWMFTTVLALAVVAAGCPGDDDPTDTDGTETATESESETETETDFMGHDSLDSYAGPATCLECHPKAMNQVMESVHYKFMGELPEDYLYKENGSPVDSLYTGKFFKVCGFPTALPQANWLGKLKDDPATPYIDNPGGCGKCHVGIGIMPSTGMGSSEPTADEKKYNVDCLVCHAADYQRKFYVATTDGQPDIGPSGTPLVFAVPRVDGVFDFSDQLEAAKTVGLASTATCNRCHAKSGGGGMKFGDTMYNFKRGVGFGHDSDVHAKAGLQCTDCHAGEEHKMERGVNNDLTAYDGLLADGGCERCHDDHKHSESKIDAHYSTVACATCHVTSKGGVTYKDYSQVVCPSGDCSAESMNTYGVKMTKFPENFAITYTWFNGTAEKPIHPLGGPGDGKIYPFKKGTFNQPVDAAGQAIPVKWGKVFVAGDMPGAISVGRAKYQGLLDSFNGDPAEYGLPPLPGPFDRYQEVDDYFSLSHGITKDNALGCTSCHSKSDSVLDWQALGLTNPMPL